MATSSARMHGMPPILARQCRKTPPNATDIEVAVGSKNNNLTVCGNHCQGHQDCWQSITDTDCNCALPFPDDAHTLGIDPIFPQAVVWYYRLWWCQACLAPGIPQSMLTAGENPTDVYVTRHSLRLNAAGRKTALYIWVKIDALTQSNGAFRS